MTIPVQQLDVPALRYDKVIWKDDERMLIFLHKSTFVDPPAYIELGTNEVAQLALPAETKCSRPADWVVDLLPDGRVSLMRNCLTETRMLPQPYTLKAYSLSTRQIEDLLDTPFSYGRIGYSTWNSDLTRGIVELEPPYGTLGWLTSDGVELMELKVHAEGRSWTLADGLPGPSGLKDPGIGIAVKPNWSTTTNRIAFFASMDDLHFSRFAIYVVDPNEEDAQALKDGFYEPGHIRWSRDGKWLAIAAAWGHVAKQGIWLLSADGSIFYQVALSGSDTGFSDIAWSPDGQMLAAIFDPISIDGVSQVSIYDLRSLSSSVR